MQDPMLAEGVARPTEFAAILTGVGRMAHVASLHVFEHVTLLRTPIVAVQAGPEAVHLRAARLKRQNSVSVWFRYVKKR